MLFLLDTVVQLSLVHTDSHFTVLLGAIPAHQSVGSSTFVITPSFSIRWSSSFTFSRRGIGALLVCDESIWAIIICELDDVVIIELA